MHGLRPREVFGRVEGGTGSNRGPRAQDRGPERLAAASFGPLSCGDHSPSRGSLRRPEERRGITQHAAVEQVLVEDGAPRLRVLIANERRDRLELLADVVRGLGHEVIAREIEVKEVAAVTAREQPDVALVGLGVSSEHALDLIGEIVREASCPVIALLTARDSGYVREAARRGVFAYIVDSTPEELQSAIDITLQRFAEYHSLQGAFGRRAVIEQAKGILMERHSVDGDRAFELLREQSQRGGRKLADIAAAVVASHALLPALARPSDVAPQAGDG
jgi:AmiR/NasT family two-component response regulator